MHWLLSHMLPAGHKPPVKSYHERDGVCSEVQHAGSPLKNSMHPVYVYKLCF